MERLAAICTARLELVGLSWFDPLDGNLFDHWYRVVCD